MRCDGIEFKKMLTPIAVIGFFVLDVLLLIVSLALGLMLLTALSDDPGAFQISLLSKSDVIRALGASTVFMILSGYVVSVMILTMIFRNRLLSRARAFWLALMFAVHSGVFLFYLRAPAAQISSVRLIAIGFICVIAVTSLEYFLWRRWISRLMRQKNDTRA